MKELIPFFLVLFTAVFFSEIFKRLHLPWVVALIFGGIIIGPFGLGFLEPNSTIEFLGQIGLVFLMFIAGLETKLSTFNESKKDIAVLSFLNSLIPFSVGFLISWFFGFGLMTSLLVGIVFVSSSIAVVIPILESLGLIKEKIGRTIVASVIVQDVLSLVFLAMILQIAAPVTRFPLPIFLLLLILMFYFFKFIIPRVQWFFSLKDEKIGDIFQQELRSVFTILIGMVVAFEILGIHPIVAGFIAGLLLSDNMKSQVLKDKIQVISYGLFIPIFFVIVGTKTDLTVFLNLENGLILVTLIVLGSMLSKFFSGFLAGRFIGYNKEKSALIGTSTTPSLSTTLAVAFTGVEFGLMSNQLATSLIILSIITALISPTIMNFIGSRIKTKENLVPDI